MIRIIFLVIDLVRFVVKSTASLWTRFRSPLQGVSSTTGIISILRTSLPTTHVSATPPPNSYPNISHPTISPQLSSDPFYEMFCSNVAAINCAHGFDVTCGSDGRLYPNRYVHAKGNLNSWFKFYRPVLLLKCKSTNIFLTAVWELMP